MPQLIVYIAQGRTIEQKRAFLHQVTDATVDTLGVAREAVTIQIVEAPRTDKSQGGVVFTDRK